MKDNFLEILNRLNKAKVDYVIIGGFASVVHGSTIVTQDLDIACSFSSQNILHLAKALYDLKPIHRMTPKKIAFRPTEDNIRKLKNLYLDTELGQLDCIGSVEGLGDFEHVKAASHKVKIRNLSCKVLDIDALIKAKKALAREKDKLAISQLRALKDLKTHKNPKGKK